MLMWSALVALAISVLLLGPLSDSTPSWTGEAAIVLLVVAVFVLVCLDQIGAGRQDEPARRLNQAEEAESQIPLIRQSALVRLVPHFPAKRGRFAGKCSKAGCEEVETGSSPRAMRRQRVGASDPKVESTFGIHSMLLV